MIIKRVLEPVFVFFSKIYIHFHEEKREYWTIFPSVILASLFTINLEIISFFLIDETKGWHYVCLGVFFIIFFNLLFIKTRYEYVKNYKMSNKMKVVISMTILIDLVLIFIFANISRNGKFMW